MSSRSAGVCRQCECEEFRPSMFGEGVCRCAHRKSKHGLEPHENEKLDAAAIESMIETIKELGQGANGVVYKAKHRPTGKIVALKRLQIANDNVLRDIMKEIGIMNLCDAENIVDFYGAVVTRNEVFIAMEYCSGGSLTKLMEKRGRAYTEEENAVITRNVLKALVYMHMSRRCHRDIKPENILLSGRGVPKLADFGISVQMGKGTKQMATLIGTPIFLAPEIITSDSGYDTKVDVWALGISVIILLDGAPPYGEVDPVRAMFLISQSTEPPTMANPAEWSPELNNFVACCLQRNPADRSSSIDLLSHPYMARYSHIKTVSTSVKHDKVQTIQAGESSDASTNVAVALGGGTPRASAARDAGVDLRTSTGSLGSESSRRRKDDDKTDSERRAEKKAEQERRAEKKAEQERRDQEEKDMIEQERKEQERKEQEHKEQERREQERKEQERKEQERKEQERKELERKEQEEKDKKERAERAEKEKKEQERKDREDRKEKEKKETERKERNRSSHKRSDSADGTPPPPPPPAVVVDDTKHRRGHRVSADDTNTPDKRTGSDRRKDRSRASPPATPKGKRNLSVARAATPSPRGKEKRASVISPSTGSGSARNPRDSVGRSKRSASDADTKPKSSTSPPAAAPRPTSVAPAPRPAAPRPDVVAPAPPGKPVGAAPKPKSKKDEEAEKLEWERILAEEREKAKRKESKKK